MKCRLHNGGKMPFARFGQKAAQNFGCATTAHIRGPAQERNGRAYEIHSGCKSCLRCH